MWELRFTFRAWEGQWEASAGQADASGIDTQSSKIQVSVWDGEQNTRPKVSQRQPSLKEKTKQEVQSWQTAGADLEVRRSMASDEGVRVQDTRVPAAVCPGSWLSCVWVKGRVFTPTPSACPILSFRTMAQSTVWIFLGWQPQKKTKKQGSACPWKVNPLHSFGEDRVTQGAVI